MATKPKSSKYIIADSSALVSLFVTTDTNNKKTRSILTTVSETERVIVIPCEVFAETINLLGKKFSHNQATEAASLLLQTAMFIVTPTTVIMRENALRIFSKMSKGVSYTDCLVMAVADLYGTSAIFGFENIFRKSGYTLPIAEKEKS
jgi:predicted nucleic acid-binding protein